jgi:hypothetical protein
LHSSNLEDEWDSQKKKDGYKAGSKDDQVEKDKKSGLEKTHKAILALIVKTRAEWDKVKDWKKPDCW